MGNKVPKKYKKLKPLSESQWKALRVMKGKDWEDAYTLRIKLVTLNGLYHRHLVDQFRGFGSLFLPRSGILWKLSLLGVMKLKELEEEEKITKDLASVDSN